MPNQPRRNRRLVQTGLCSTYAQMFQLSQNTRCCNMTIWYMILDCSTRLCMHQGEAIKYLTERMQPMARTGYFFHLRNGRSTEYAMPSKRLPTRVANKGAEPM